MDLDKMEKLYKIVNGITIEFSETDYREYAENQSKGELEKLPNAKIAKKEEIKELRTKVLSTDLLAKVIDGKSYYVKTDPEINLFSSAILMESGSTRFWGCYVDGKKELLELTKAELLSIAQHYEFRKSQQYNFCDLRIAEINSMASLEEVESFDINKVYEI
jgi:hypothetical protein